MEDTIHPDPGHTNSHMQMILHLHCSRPGVMDESVGGDDFAAGHMQGNPKWVDNPPAGSYVSDMRDQVMAGSGERITEGEELSGNLKMAADGSMIEVGKDEKRQRRRRLPRRGTRRRR